MNILCTLEEFLLNVFPEQFSVIRNPFKRKLSEEEVDRMIQQYQPVGLIAGVEPLTRRVLERAKNLRVISRYGVGLDSIDLQAAQDLGIKVLNTPDAPTAAVAELTLGLILALARRIWIADREIRQAKWERPLGTLLSGKRVGIIGLGRIGSYVGRLTQAFGCFNIGYDPWVKNPGYCQWVSLDELMRTADIITLHIPHNAESHHLINEQQLNRMKPGALLINAGRGGLIDESALYFALKSGKIGGAALDCFSEEPYSGALCELDTILMTSHIGSNTRETKELMERQSLANLVEALRSMSLLE